MGRRQAMEERRRSMAQAAGKGEFDWPEFCRRLDAGQVIPIVSNGVLNELIFPMSDDELQEIEPGRTNPLGWSIEEHLAVQWAGDIRYPLPEAHMLSRVALYDRVIHDTDNIKAKRRYLDWLNWSLLAQAEFDKTVPTDRLEELSAEVEKGDVSLSYLAAELGYPRPSVANTNTLEVLARLKLPIYITTSPFDLLERAIIAHSRRPRTQICFWRGVLPQNWDDPAHKPDYHFQPTEAEPLVYHIFGHEAYPETMVLSEDDYLDFLTAIAKDTDQTEPKLPIYLRGAVAQSTLMLIGYRLRDFDFRVIFRGLINVIQNAASLQGDRPRGLTIQMNPRQRLTGEEGEALVKYLTTYFKEAKFDIAWQTTADFAVQLWQEYEKWRR